VKPEALLVTPLPPLETGLATFAGRILSATFDDLDWTVAYTSGSSPLPGFRCIPAERLAPGEAPALRLFQVGNSPHCAEVLRLLERIGGAALFHEVNLHHLLRHTADTTGNWENYRRHVFRQYGPEAPEVLSRMNRRARSREEYDSRLRACPLLGMVTDWCDSLACLNGYSREVLLSRDDRRRILVLGHPLDPLPEPLPPAPRFPEGVLVAGVAGGFGFGRGWDHVLSVVSEIRRTREAVLVAAGAGWPSRGLPWVRVMGRLSEPEYQAVIRTFHLGLDLRQGSCGETSGSLLELLRAGLPVITGDSGSFREIPAGAVLRVPSEALPQAAAAAARFLLDNPDQMEAISREAVDYAAVQGNRKDFRHGLLKLLGVASGEPSK
jgi:glycosyltransferase involved in cell wall biosynthesis